MEINELVIFIPICLTILGASFLYFGSLFNIFEARRLSQISKYTSGFFYTIRYILIPLMLVLLLRNGFDTICAQLGKPYITDFELFLFKHRILFSFMFSLPILYRFTSIIYFYHNGRMYNKSDKFIASMGSIKKSLYYTLPSEKLKFVNGTFILLALTIQIYITIISLLNSNLKIESISMGDILHITQNDLLTLILFMWLFVLLTSSAVLEGYNFQKFAVVKVHMRNHPPIEGQVSEIGEYVKIKSDKSILLVNPADVIFIEEEIE